MQELLSLTTNIYSFLVTSAVFIITILVLRTILSGPDKKTEEPKEPEA